MDDYTKMKNGNDCSCSMAKNLYCYFPNSITLTADVVAGSGANELRFPDACGLFDSLGIGNPITTQDFDVRGAVTADNVRAFCQTHAGRIKMINYRCEQDVSQLNNKIKMIAASIDEQSGTAKIFDVAIDQRNTQFTQTLQTVYPHKGDAYLTNTSGFLVSTADDINKTVELTLQFDRWASYDDISENCGL
jgi:hypothetical protein